MLKHNLLLFFRNIKKHKSTFLINVIGLSTGLAGVLLIALWVVDELSVDAFHTNDDRLYQVLGNYETEGKIETLPYLPDLLAETMAEELPGVEAAVGIVPSEWFGSNLPLSFGNKIIKADGQFVGRDFFKLFSFSLLEGDPSQVLADKNSIVISESLAKKIFGTSEGIIGKTLSWETAGLASKQLQQVSGVLKNIPAHSSQQFEFLLPFEKWKDVSVSVGRNIHWGNAGPMTYLLLAKGTNTQQFSNKLYKYIKNKSQEAESLLFMKKYSKNYLYGKYENGIQTGGRIESVRLFSTIALFILLIACINFMNLSTANASRRINEIGIKKALGSERKTLVGQYLGESLMLTLFSTGMAIILVWVFMPQFNAITGKQLSLELNGTLLLSILTITLLTGLLAGSYPALYLSGFNTGAILKGNLVTSLGELLTRKGLVVFQFSLSIVLIISVLVVYKQIEFVQNQNLGYEKDNVVYFGKEGKLRQNSNAFIENINRIPGILNASATDSNLMGDHGTTAGLDWEGKNVKETLRFGIFAVDHDMMETFGMQMKNGRTFSKEFSSDSTKIILNETAIKTMGLQNPIGKSVNLWGREKQIIGVVKDFYFNSFREIMMPLVIRYNPKETTMIMVRVAKGKEKEVLKNLEKAYEEFNPGYTMELNFLDEDFQKLYSSEQRLANLSKYFASLAIIISCLGLFGLAAFTAERRRKEISIRKVLGQSATQVTMMLSGGFAKLVLVAICIAIPIAYVLSSDWLSGFAYRIPLKLWYFLGAGLVALTVAMLTVGSQAIRAANKNPVNALREE